MKQILLPILVVVVFIISVGLLTQRVQDGNLAFPETRNNQTLEKEEIKIEDSTISVEIVKTEIQRRQGLSGKENLPEGEGMLFIFESKNIQPPFWMKDMKLAIDIIWIDDDKVVQIDKDIQPPEPRTPDNELVLYTPNQPIDYVLEVNAGFSEENKIKVGDGVNLSVIE
ncbi:MAG: DUF192 domain-containing protein [Microgenomates group bacterium]